jgi:nitronate monooxygenase
MTAVPSVTSMRTRVTELFGIRFPITQGGMQWVGRAELAAAVSNAGGLGILTGLTQSTPDALAKEIDRCRTMTQEPFAVNMTIFPTITSPPYRAYIDAIVAGGVKIVETAGVRSQEFWPAMRAAGIKIIHKCVAVRHAVAAQRMGVDAHQHRWI